MVDSIVSVPIIIIIFTLLIFLDYVNSSVLNGCITSLWNI